MAHSSRGDDVVIAITKIEDEESDSAKRVSVAAPRRMLSCFE